LRFDLCVTCRDAVAREKAKENPRVRTIEHWIDRKCSALRSTRTTPVFNPATGVQLVVAYPAEASYHFPTAT
jgi:hypothetical protein